MAKDTFDLFRPLIDAAFAPDVEKIDPIEANGLLYARAVQESRRDGCADPQHWLNRAAGYKAELAYLLKAA